MAAKAKPKLKARPQPKSTKKRTTQSKAKPKKPVMPQRSPSTKAKSKNRKVGSKKQAKGKTKAATQATSRSKATPKKVVKGKAKKLTKSQKVGKPISSAKSAKRNKSAPTTSKKITRTAGSKGKAPRPKAGKAAKTPEVKPFPVQEKRRPGRPKKDAGAVKGVDEKKTKVSKVVPPVSVDEGGLGEETSDLDVVETALPDDIDSELDIEVEGDRDITLDALTTELDDATDALDVDDLTDDFDDDDFSEDLADEGDEELDLTEDLSEELGADKFFRETEPNVEDDEEEIPRSW